MHKSKIVFAVIAVIVLVAGAALFSIFNKPINNRDIKVNTTLVAVTPVPTDTITPPTPTSSSKYTAEFRALARSAFISRCKLKIGQEYTSACNCGADYLAAHYSDSQLEKVYVEYHSTNKIPSEIQAAYDACKDK